VIDTIRAQIEANRLALAELEKALKANPNGRLSGLLLAKVLIDLDRAAGKLQKHLGQLAQANGRAE
jgi:hypothetical protein